MTGVSGGTQSSFIEQVIGGDSWHWPTMSVQMNRGSAKVVVPASSGPLGVHGSGTRVNVGLIVTTSNTSGGGATNASPM